MTEGCFYEKECINSSWSVRELKRQIESSLFERLLLSHGDANKETVLDMASRGVDYTKPEAMIKDPLILCTDKDDLAVEYALGGLSNQIFASTYVLHMPDKEQLIAQVEAVLDRWHGE